MTAGNGKSKYIAVLTGRAGACQMPAIHPSDHNNFRQSRSNAGDCDGEVSFLLCILSPWRDTSYFAM